MMFPNKPNKREAVEKCVTYIRLSMNWCVPKAGLWTQHGLATTV